MLYYGHSLVVEVVGMSQEEHRLEEYPEVHFDPLYLCRTLQLLFAQILCPVNAFVQILLHGHSQTWWRGLIGNWTEVDQDQGRIFSGLACMLLMRFLPGGSAFVVP